MGWRSSSCTVDANSRFKDSFYDGYELLFSKQLFKEMELATDQLMPVEDLRNFLQRQRKHKTFEYIFFE